MVTLEELTNLFAEEHRKTEEERRKTEEAFRKLAETHARFSAELLQFKEENRIGFEKLRESQQETEEIFRKSEEKSRKDRESLDKALRKTDRNFNTQWGRLVEALVNNQVVPLLQSRNIPVIETAQNIKGCVNGRNFEFDIIARNGDTLVVIEVKTTLRSEDVKEFLDELRHFKTWKPEYSDKKVIGTVAYLREEGDAATTARNKGLYMILATGSSARITNPEDSEPRVY